MVEPTALAVEEFGSLAMVLPPSLRATVSVT